jgi:hypothetical protein
VEDAITLANKYLQSKSPTSGMKHSMKHSWNTSSGRVFHKVFHGFLESEKNQYPIGSPCETPVKHSHNLLNARVLVDHLIFLENEFSTGIPSEMESQFCRAWAEEDLPKLRLIGMEIETYLKGAVRE